MGRNRRALLAAVLVVAAAVRIAALLGMERSLYGDFLLWDERTYDSWARAITAGARFSVYDQSALPAYVIAAVYRLFAPAPIYVRTINVIWGVLTCWLLYRTGRELAGTAAGLLSAAGAALYKPFVFLNVTLLKESLGLLLFSWMIFLFVADMNGHKRLRVLLLGIAAGLVLDVRQNAILVIATIAAVVAWHAFRHTRSWAAAVISLIALGGGVAISSAPFMLRNYAVTGTLSSVPVSGFNLFLGNYLPSGTPYYRPVPFATSVASEQGIQFTIEASRRAGRKLTPAEASRYWEREVLATAWRQPRAFAWKLLQKTLAVFHRFEEADNHHIGFVSTFVPFFRLPLLAFWFVMPLGMAGLIMAAREDGRAMALLSVSVAYAATVVLVFSNMRIRLPLLAILLPYAAIGLIRILEHNRSHFRMRVAYGSLVLAFVAVENLPLSGADDLTAHYNTHAINLTQRGRAEEALAYWRVSSAVRGAYSDFADLALALDEFWHRGDAGAALARASRIGDGSYAAALKYDFIGDILRARGRPSESAAAYEKSLSINSGQIFTRQKLADLHRMTDPVKAAAEEAQLRYVKSFYEVISRQRAIQ